MELKFSIWLYFLLLTLAPILNAYHSKKTNYAKRCVRNQQKLPDIKASYYHVCQKQGHKFIEKQFKCKTSKYHFNPHAGKCTPVPGGGIGLLRHQYSKKKCNDRFTGLMRTNSTHYEICMPGNHFSAKCSKRKVFDDWIEKCVNPAFVQRENHIADSKVIQGKLIPVPACRWPGIFYVPQFLKYYYLCHVRGKKIYQYIRKCPEKQLFDNYLSKCTKKTSPNLRKYSIPARNCHYYYTCRPFKGSYKCTLQKCKKDKKYDDRTKHCIPIGDWFCKGKDKKPGKSVVIVHLNQSSSSQQNSHNDMYNNLTQEIAHYEEGAKDIEFLNETTGPGQTTEDPYKSTTTEDNLHGDIHTTTEEEFPEETTESSDVTNPETTESDDGSGSTGSTESGSTDEPSISNVEGIKLLPVSTNGYLYLAQNNKKDPELHLLLNMKLLTIKQLIQLAKLETSFDITTLGSNDRSEPDSHQIRKLLKEFLSESQSERRESGATSCSDGDCECRCCCCKSCDGAKIPDHHPSSSSSSLSSSQEPSNLDSQSLSHTCESIYDNTCQNINSIPNQDIPKSCDPSDPGDPGCEKPNSSSSGGSNGPKPSSSESCPPGDPNCSQSGSSSPSGWPSINSCEPGNPGCEEPNSSSSGSSSGPKPSSSESCPPGDQNCSQSVSSSPSGWPSINSCEPGNPDCEEPNSPSSGSSSGPKPSSSESCPPGDPNCSQSGSASPSGWPSINSCEPGNPGCEELNSPSSGSSSGPKPSSSESCPPGDPNCSQSGSSSSSGWPSINSCEPGNPGCEKPNSPSSGSSSGPKPSSSESCPPGDPNCSQSGSSSSSGRPDKIHCEPGDPSCEEPNFPSDNSSKPSKSNCESSEGSCQEPSSSSSEDSIGSDSSDGEWPSRNSCEEDGTCQETTSSSSGDPSGSKPGQASSLSTSAWFNITDCEPGDEGCKEPTSSSSGDPSSSTSSSLSPSDLPNVYSCESDDNSCKESTSSSVGDPSGSKPDQHVSSSTSTWFNITDCEPGDEGCKEPTSSSSGDPSGSTSNSSSPSDLPNIYSCESDNSCKEPTSSSSGDSNDSSSSFLDADELPSVYSCESHEENCPEPSFPSSDSSESKSDPNKLCRPGDDNCIQLTITNEKGLDSSGSGADNINNCEPGDESCLEHITSSSGEEGIGKENGFYSSDSSKSGNNICESWDTGCQESSSSSSRSRSIHDSKKPPHQKPCKPNDDSCLESSPTESGGSFGISCESGDIGCQESSSSSGEEGEHDNSNPNKSGYVSGSVGVTFGQNHSVSYDTIDKIHGTGSTQETNSKGSSGGIFSNDQLYEHLINSESEFPDTLTGSEGESIENPPKIKPKHSIESSSSRHSGQPTGSISVSISKHDSGKSKYHVSKSNEPYSGTSGSSDGNESHGEGIKQHFSNESKNPQEKNITILVWDNNVNQTKVSGDDYGTLSHGQYDNGNHGTKYTGGEHGSHGTTWHMHHEYEHVHYGKETEHHSTEHEGQNKVHDTTTKEETNSTGLSGDISSVKLGKDEESDSGNKWDIHYSTKPGYHGTKDESSGTESGENGKKHEHHVNQWNIHYSNKPGHHGTKHESSGTESGENGKKHEHHVNQLQIHYSTNPEHHGTKHEDGSMEGGASGAGQGYHGIPWHIYNSNKSEYHGTKHKGGGMEDEDKGAGYGHHTIPWHIYNSNKSGHHGTKHGGGATENGHHKTSGHKSHGHGTKHHGTRHNSTRRTYHYSTHKKHENSKKRMDERRRELPSLIQTGSTIELHSGLNENDERNMKAEMNDKKKEIDNKINELVLKKITIMENSADESDNTDIHNALHSIEQQMQKLDEIKNNINMKLAHLDVLKRKREERRKKRGENKKFRTIISATRLEKSLPDNSIESGNQQFNNFPENYDRKTARLLQSVFGNRMKWMDNSMGRRNNYEDSRPMPYKKLSKEKKRTRHLGDSNN